MDASARYHPVQDQIDLAAAMGDALADMLPIARLHAAPTEQDDVWDQLRQLGLFSICKSEADGGSGLGVVEETLIATALGRQLVSPSIIATLAAQAFPALPDGARVAAGYVDQGRTNAFDVTGSDAVLVREDDRVLLVSADDMDFRAVEQTLWLSPLFAANAAGSLLAEADGPSLLRLRLLDAAALAGIAACALDMAVAYALVREQFGRPIGSFQAVKHSCANMAIAARCARDQVNFAAVALDSGRDDAALQIESALLVAIDAALDNAGRDTQIHGGMGFSDEADAHLVLKRARGFASIAGGSEKAIERIAAVPFAR